MWDTVLVLLTMCSVDIETHPFVGRGVYVSAKVLHKASPVEYIEDKVICRVLHIHSCTLLSHYVVVELHPSTSIQQNLGEGRVKCGATLSNGKNIAMKCTSLSYVASRSVYV